MMDKYERICACIDLDAIRCNVERMAEQIPDGTGIYAVIKADGYGHGAVPVAGELEPLPCILGFATATIEEALELRRSGVKKPILILGNTFSYGFKQLAEEDIRSTVFDRETAQELNACVERLNRERRKADTEAPLLKAKVHVKVDTGMSRIGIRPDEEGLFFVRELMGMPGLEVEGIFTHFARADEKDLEPTLKQYRLFTQFVQQAQKETGKRIPLRHCSNSAGIIGLTEASMDAVRAGIILYGLWPSEEVSKDRIPLRPAMELRSHVVCVKDVSAGTPVSYGGTFVTERPSRIATVPVGYADGYPRGLSNKGQVLIRGRRAPVIGRVCMDQFMVDVTDIKGVEKGDLVTLVGRNGPEFIPMEELAALSGRFNYEFACLIGKRVPRVYRKEGKIIFSQELNTFG